MALSQATIEDGLNSMGLYTVESEAALELAGVYDEYFKAATANAVPITEGATEGAKSAFAGALSGMSQSGAGAAKLASAVGAYWTAIAASPAAVFSGCTLITPPTTLAGLAAAIGAVFSQNIAEVASKTVCSGRIANVLHTNSQGGSATFPGPLAATIQ